MRRGQWVNSIDRRSGRRSGSAGSSVSWPIRRIVMAGIYLINQLMDEVRIERGGTEIHMRKN